MLCSKFHYQKGFSLIVVSCKIVFLISLVRFLPDDKGPVCPAPKYSRAISYPWSPFRPEAGQSRTRSSQSVFRVSRALSGFEFRVQVMVSGSGFRVSESWFWVSGFGSVGFRVSGFGGAGFMVSDFGFRGCEV